MKVLSNAELTQRLEKLEQSFFASRNREVSNTYTAENADSKVNAITPTTYTKTAYIGDTKVVFEDVIDGNITAYVEDTEGSYLNYQIVKQDNRVIIIFYAPLEYVTTVTITIL